MLILRARKVELFTFKNGQETGTEFIALWRQFVCLGLFTPCHWGEIQRSRKLNMQKWVNYWLKVPMKRKFYRHNLKHTIPKFWVPTIKIVDFTNAQSWAIYLQKWSGDWNRIYCVVTSVCVFRFVYTLP